MFVKKVLRCQNSRTYGGDRGNRAASKTLVALEKCRKVELEMKCLSLEGKSQKSSVFWGNANMSTLTNPVVGWHELHFTLLSYERGESLSTSSAVSTVESDGNGHPSSERESTLSRVLCSELGKCWWEKYESIPAPAMVQVCLWMALDINHPTTSPFMIFMSLLQLDASGHHRVTEHSWGKNSPHQKKW